MKSIREVGICMCAGLALIVLPLRATDQKNSAQPGTVNYIEGQVSLASEELNVASIGKLQLDPGQTLTTETGKAEILLTPGVFVRVGNSSAVTMVAASLTTTRMSIDQGEAYVEVDEFHPENDLRILQDGLTIQLEKMGLYNFNANLHVFRVLDGEATVESGERSLHVKKGYMVNLRATPLKASKFDRVAIEAEDLYRWTMLRSSYLAEANADAAPGYAYGGFGWFGEGWYWDPWFSAFTFLPADGIFYSPFGWGFYSPWCAFGAPFFWSGHSYHHFSPTAFGTWGKEAHYRMPMNYGHGVHYASGFSAHGSFRGPRGGAFRASGGSRSAFHGGGFHGGGFHGGGFHGGGTIGGGHR